MGGGNFDEAVISVEAFADTHYVLNGVVNTKKVLFHVKTSKASDVDADALTRQRVPLNLCLVLDRSESMKDSKKLDFSKEAIISVIQSLQEDDVVHLVVYSDYATVLFENVTTADEKVSHVIEISEPVVFLLFRSNKAELLSHRGR